MSELNPRLSEVTIILVHPDRQETLTAEQARRVLDRFDTVAKEATKWRLSTQRPGRLLLIDPTLISAIELFLKTKPA
jgi:hypothetical protein